MSTSSEGSATGAGSLSRRSGTVATQTTWQLLVSVVSAGREARTARTESKDAPSHTHIRTEGRTDAAAASSSAAASTVPTPPRLDISALRRLATFARPELRPLVASVATLGLTTAVSLAFPAAIGAVLDVALTPDSAWTPTNISLAIAALFGVQSAAIVLRGALLNVSGERMAAHMRKHVLACVLSHEAAWFDAQRTGDIINRLSADTLVIQKALTSNIAGGLRSAAMSVGCVIALLYLSPSLAALSLGLIPPVALTGMYYGRYLEGQQKAVQEALGRTTQVAEEIVSCVRTVRLCARERDDALRYAVQVDDAYENARRIGIVAAYFDGAVHMAANISLVAVLWYGGHLVATGAMSAGDLTAFLIYSIYTGFNVANLSSVYTELKKASGAAARIFEITDRAPGMPLSSDPHYWRALEEQNALTDGAGLYRRRTQHSLTRGTPESEVARAAIDAVGVTSLRKPDTVRGELLFDNVLFTYPTRPDSSILQNFQLHVPAGKTVALVGGSGSGKSTVGALLTRLYDPTVGRVSLDGIDLRELDPSWLRNVIGTVSQEPTLFVGSIAENIRYGNLTATDEEVHAAARIAHAHDFITSFPNGYDTQVGERGVQLSGGQRQRIAIARALVKNPRVLLLDEATAALDSTSEAAIVEAMKDIARGRTVITIAHRLSTMRTADLVAVLQDGKVAEVGPFDQLYASPTSAFRTLINKQLSAPLATAAAV